MRARRNGPALLVLLIVISALAVPVAWATGQGGDAGRRPRRVTEGTLLWRTAQQETPMPAPVLTTDVAMRVTGVILRATVRQEFANPSSKWAEGVYVFPLPEDAAVDHRYVMNRRAFICVLGLSALAPPSAKGQQAPKVPRVGYLSSASAGAAGQVAFRQGVRELGYIEGRDIAFEDRVAEGRYDRLPSLAAELVGLNVDVIVAASPPAIQAAKDATKTIPIVMLSGGDPVRSGFVTSLARPGGNITGVALLATELLAKQLDMLKQLLPAVSRVAILWDPGMESVAEGSKDSGLEGISRSLRIRLQFAEVRRPTDFEGAFKAMAKGQAGAVVITGSPAFLRERRRIVGLAAKHRLPAIYFLKEDAEAGGLMAYGPNLSDLSRRAAAYVDKILKGAKPPELPVEQPTRFALAINLRTAKALGLSIPPSLLVRADQVIE